MVITVIYNINNKLSGDGTAQVYICARESGKRKLYTTGIKVAPDEWSDEKMILSTHPQHIHLNEILRQKIAEIEKYKYERLTAKKSFTLADFDAFMNNAKTAQKNNSEQIVVQYIARELDTDASIEKNTVRRYRVTLNILREYCPDLVFADMNYTWVKQFDNYLRSEKNLHANTIHNIHKVVKRFLKSAIAASIAPPDLNPYRDFKNKTVPFNRERISTEFLQAIENLRFTPTQAELQNACDMFLLSCYCGLRYEDLQALTPKNILTDQGVTYLKLIMQKTDTTIQLPVSLLFAGRPLQIIEQRQNRARLFDKVTNQHANRLLKAIAAMAGIEIALTFHMARHTFCSMLADATGNAFLIKEMAGHSDIKTSMIYIHTSKAATNRTLRAIDWAAITTT